MTTIIMTETATYLDGEPIIGMEWSARGFRYGPMPREIGTGPMCRCGARNTVRIGDSALQRQCQSCGHTYIYRLKDGILVPLALETALAMDGK